MAELIHLKGGRVDLKFHAKIANFKRHQRFNWGKRHFELLVDKNDSVYDILSTEVKTWKTIEQGKRKFTIRDVVHQVRATEFFDIIKGRPAALAMEKVITILDSASVTDDL